MTSWGEVFVGLSTRAFSIKSGYGVIQEVQVYYHYSVLWAIDWLEEGGLFGVFVLAWF